LIEFAVLVKGAKYRSTSKSSGGSKIRKQSGKNPFRDLTPHSDKIEGFMSRDQGKVFARFGQGSRPNARAPPRPNARARACPRILLYMFCVSFVAFVAFVAVVAFVALHSNKL
jgi:hypothetical protein